jgi:hypothetical protein
MMRAKWALMRIKSCQLVRRGLIREVGPGVFLPGLKFDMKAQNRYVKTPTASLAEMVGRVAGRQRIRLAFNLTPDVAQWQMRCQPKSGVFRTHVDWREIVGQGSGDA